VASRVYLRALRDYFFQSRGEQLSAGVLKARKSLDAGINVVCWCGKQFLYADNAFRTSRQLRNFGDQSQR
jgi:hypothetical protein